MSLRSLFAALATAWFIYLALAYMAPGTFMAPDPTMGVGQGYREILMGSDLGMAVTSAVRVIAIGLALFSAAAFEWGALLAATRASDARHRESEAPAGVREDPVVSQPADAGGIQPTD